MNLWIARTPLLYFGYRIQKPKSARLQRLATKQELTFASFNQPIGWSVALTLYLAKHSKALALTHNISFWEVINSQKFIYKASGVLRKKALPYKAYSRPPPSVKTTVKLWFTVVFTII
ncbi:hypothetical protein QUA20_25170 [Microcoleus sp. Pol7_A1]|uniref:hypothetical protein n=1 Tax=Microcoleus sp. Pol7_A1 TaxID=2818893 RepID=UPI002FD0B519